MMNDGFPCFLLLMMFLNLPKGDEYFAAPKEDLCEYNKTRRQLGQSKKQRSEFHVVQLKLSRPEVVERIGAAYSNGTGVKHGAHSVRGHKRFLRSGKAVDVRPHSRGSGPLKSIRTSYKVPG